MFILVYNFRLFKFGNLSFNYFVLLIICIVFLGFPSDNEWFKWYNWQESWRSVADMKRLSECANIFSEYVHKLVTSLISVLLYENLPGSQSVHFQVSILMVTLHKKWELTGFHMPMHQNVIQ